MIIVADNLNTRNKAYMSALEKRDAGALALMAAALYNAQADVINVQCSADGAGDDERLPWAVEVVEKAAPEAMISIDTRNMEALKKSISMVKKPPLVNYLSQTEPDDRDALLSVVARARAYLVLRASKGIIPASFEAKLQILEELLEAANEADIPNERLFLDPSLVHIGRGMGQDHIMNSHECVMAVQDMVDPPANTIIWASNVSAGLPKAARKKTEAALLLYFAGAGVDAAMVDILDPEIRKAIYFIKSFRDEIIFSPADIA
jgi:cobalamin-dependent methionine synthase I